MMDEHVVLDGYVVRRTTDAAVGIAKATVPLGRREELTWIPRSCCLDGEALEVGSDDLMIASWKAEQEGLDY